MNLTFTTMSRARSPQRPRREGWAAERKRCGASRMETGANGEISAFMDISLYYKYNGEWSEAVPGTGGSAFITKEKSGLYTSDECYKMALTDALSVACKALGIAADVYWDKDKTKYDKTDIVAKVDVTTCEKCGRSWKRTRTPKASRCRS